MGEGVAVEIEGARSVRHRGRRKSALILIAVALAAGQALGCGSQSPERGRPGGAAAKPPASHPILLIGLDGIEWNVVLEMTRQRRLPTLAGLMQRGVFGELRTLPLTLSPVIWTSVVTGKEQRKHGIRGFIHEADSDGWQRLYTQQDRKTKALWNILSESDRRVITVGWWMTFPVEEVNGMMVAQVTTTTPETQRAADRIWKGSLLEGLEGQVYPPDREAELLSVVRQVKSRVPEITPRIFGNIPDALGEVPRRLWKHCLWAFRADAIYRRIGLKLLAENPDFDLFAIYFGGADVVGHRFWRYAYPELYEKRPSDEEIEALGGVIQDYYAYLDGVVAELIEAAPDDVVVLVLSDHGMTPSNRKGVFAPDDPAGALNSGAHEDAPPGVFIAAGPGLKQTVTDRPVRDLTRDDLQDIGSVLDITPTVLALLGLAVGRDMDGRVMEEIIDPVVLAENPIRHIASHDPWLDLRALRSRLGFGARRRDEATVERLEQLRALGYVE